MTNPLLKPWVTVKIITNPKAQALIHQSCGQPWDGTGLGDPGGSGRLEWPELRSQEPQGARGSNYSLSGMAVFQYFSNWFTPRCVPG